MKRLIAYMLICSLATLSVTAGGCGQKTAQPEGPAPEAAALRLRFSVDLPPTSDTAVAIQEMAERVHKSTNGKCTIEVHAGGTLASAKEALNLVGAGAIDMAENALEYLSENDIRFAAIQLPFQFNSMEANATFLKFITQSLYKDILAEKFNVVPLAVWTTGVHQVFGTKRSGPIRTLSDWRGRLTWCGSPIAVDTVRALGGAPVQLAFWDGYPALQKGTVDSAVGVHPYGVTSFKWYDVIGYATIANIFGTSVCFYINKDVFNRMPTDVREVLVQEMERLEGDLQSKYIEHQKEALRELEEAGVEVYYLPDDERAKWVERTQKVIEDFYARISPEDARKIQEVIEQANRIAGPEKSANK